MLTRRIAGWVPRRRTLPAEQVQLDHLPVVDEHHRRGHPRAAADPLQRRVQVRLAAPQLGHPDHIRLVGLPADQVERAAGVVLQPSRGGEQYLGQLAALALLGSRLAVARDLAHYRTTNVNDTSANAGAGPPVAVFTWNDPAVSGNTPDSCVSAPVSRGVITPAVVGLPLKRTS